MSQTRFIAFAALFLAARSAHAFEFSTDIARAYAALDETEDPASSDLDDLHEPEQAPQFGDKGTTRLTFGSAYANDLGDSNDFNLHAAYSVFLEQDFEFIVELAGWYFDQEGDDTAGVSGSMIFRYHFFPQDTREWSAYVDAGIGLLAGFDEVPDGGTEFNFLPRVGAGLTGSLDQLRDGARWIVGVRWHHISNARIRGDQQNPSRDAVLVYAGITLPF